MIWMRLWWFLQYFFISTNMKFSHIHIIMHRRGAWWNLGGGKEVPKVVNGFVMYLLLLKMNWGEQQR